MNNLSLPDDVLVIHYLDLSAVPDIRLELCRVIGQLLAHSGGALPLPDLSISPIAQDAFQVWLTTSEVQHFWRIEEQSIVTNEPCTRHLLVGTRFLLADLNHVKREQSPNLKQLDVLWRAAAQLLRQP
jgi:hypothetical protein